MKIILEYNLPDEEHSSKIAINSGDIYFALMEIRNVVMGYFKHGHSFKDIDDSINYIYELICDVTRKIGVIEWRNYARNKQ